MRAFDPKEYKRDIVVVNIHKGNVLLVFPTGAVVKDGFELLEGEDQDERRLANFYKIADVAAKGEALEKLIKEWLLMVD